MKFEVDSKIFEKWPKVKIGVIVLTGIDNGGHNGEVLKLLRNEEARLKSELLGVDFSQMPEVAVWREVYKEFGSNPHDFRSSIEALLRRVRTGNPLPQINNLVDLYNFLSIKYRLPVGAEGLDKTSGDIRLTFSDGMEKGRYIGSEVEDVCNIGEVIYRDDLGFICRRWNWREADRTKIDETTKNAVLVIEAMRLETEERLRSCLEEGIELIGRYLGGEARTSVLSFDSPVFELR
jgi:DNA/RNA-binding domain of Phe-tRNA-synthetase-like protein